MGVIILNILFSKMIEAKAGREIKNTHELIPGKVYDIFRDGGCNKLKIYLSDILKIGTLSDRAFIKSESNEFSFTPISINPRDLERYHVFINIGVGTSDILFKNNVHTVSDLFKTIMNTVDGEGHRLCARTSLSSPLKSNLSKLDLVTHGVSIVPERNTICNLSESQKAQLELDIPIKDVRNAYEVYLGGYCWLLEGWLHMDKPMDNSDRLQAKRTLVMAKSFVDTNASPQQIAAKLNAISDCMTRY